MNLIEWQVKLFNDLNVSTPPVSVNETFVIITAEKPEEISSNSVLYLMGGGASNQKGWETLAVSKPNMMKI